MNVNISDIDPEAQAAAIAPLLKEYTDKMRDLGDELRGILKEHGDKVAKRKLSGMAADKKESARAIQELNSMRWRYNRLQPPLEDLIRVASQLADHAKLRPASRIELALRCAELEGEVQGLREKIFQQPDA